MANIASWHLGTVKRRQKGKEELKGEKGGVSGMSVLQSATAAGPEGGGAAVPSGRWEVGAVGGDKPGGAEPASEYDQLELWAPLPH